MFNFFPTDIFKMYLRKSRADLEAEARGEGDVLKRHEQMLYDTAKRLGIVIKEEDIHREVVSGETIADRVEMQKLLREVQSGRVRGVLVVEVERLSRGDNIDQGIVAQTFKYSNTLVITPMKIYDPNDEFDEEYFEYGLFQSRREYKTTTRRMQRGALASAIEGKYVGNKPPYGYTRKKLEKEKGFILEILPEQAEAVRLMFDLYVNKDLGPAPIADELDRLGYKPAHLEHWSVPTIRGMIENPHYAGYTCRGRRSQVKSMVDGVIIKTRPKNNGYQKYEGRHEAIVDRETWEKAQGKLRANLRPRVTTQLSIKNPLAGIIKCGLCGKNMIRRPMPEQLDTLLCNNRHCNNIGSYLAYVEEDVLTAIDTWIKDHTLTISTPDVEQPSDIDRLKRMIAKEEKEISTVKSQIGKLRDLLEQDVYTVEVYMDRLKALADRENAANQRLIKLNDELSSYSDHNISLVIPRLENILEAYKAVSDPAERNTLLRSAISSIVYTKLEKGGQTPESQRNYTLEINPYFFDD